MAGQVIQEGDEDAALSDINVVPLTDVMLVLLIVFLITIPVVVHQVPVQLPKVAYQPTVTKPENVSLSVRGGPGGTCEVYWGLQKVSQKQLLDMAVQKLETLIKDVGGVQNVNEDNMPEAHIRGDINTPYKCIGATIISMQQAGFQRVGFISQPGPGSAPRL